MRFSALLVALTTLLCISSCNPSTGDAGKQSAVPAALDTTLPDAAAMKKSREVRVLTREELKGEFGSIDSTNYSELPLYRAYEYGDEDGYHIVLLCEAPYTSHDKDTLHDRLEAIGLMHDHGGHLVKWRIRDLRERSEQEEDIRFWTKYCRFKDLDGDGHVEPIIVYASYAQEEVRRLKILTVYRKQKYAVRAVECELDDCRTLQYDASFRQLPQAIQDSVESVMEHLRQEQGVLLKDG